jgi:hypothetical protein
MLVEAGQIQFDPTLVVGRKVFRTLFAPEAMAGRAAVTPVTGFLTATLSPVHLVEKIVFTYFNDEEKKDVK